MVMGTTLLLRPPLLTCRCSFAAADSTNKQQHTRRRRRATSSAGGVQTVVVLISSLVCTDRLTRPVHYYFSWDIDRVGGEPAVLIFKARIARE
jgi:hypothetical protein